MMQSSPMASTLAAAAAAKTPGPGVAADHCSSNKVPVPASAQKAAQSQRRAKKSEETIKVVLRMRPLSNREQSHGRAWKVNNTDNTILQINADGEHEPGHDVYEYAHTFGEESTNHEVYKAVAEPIVSDVLQGYHGTILTYGQTASGKTFTMEGILKLAARDIFRFNVENVLEESSNTKCAVKVSFIEVYNGGVSDLLTSEAESKLDVRNFSVKSHETGVSTMTELLDVLSRGEKNRSVGSTKMNDHSSRSHTIIKITLEKILEDDDGGKKSCFTTLNLVDLAGSENVKQTGATGGRQVEGANINKSLLHLQRVIEQLGQNATKKTNDWVNYRDSTLTQLLQPSLSGNAKVAILCCATPSRIFLTQTRSTLQFANRAQIIKTRAGKERLTILESHRKSVAKMRQVKTPGKKASQATPAKERHSFMASSSRRVAKIKQFLSPTGKCKATSANPQRQCPKTDVKAKRSKILFTAIPEDENTALQKALDEKNGKINSLENELKFTKDELQATQKDVQRHKAEIEWLQSDNKDLVSKVANLEADKEFVQLEAQAMENELTNDNCILEKVLNSEHDCFARRESHDTDATEEYIVTAEMKQSSMDGGDSYESIVFELENSKAEIWDLKELVKNVQRENELLRADTGAPVNSTLANNKAAGKVLPAVLVKVPTESTDETVRATKGQTHIVAQSGHSKEYTTPTKAADAPNISKKRTPLGMLPLSLPNANLPGRVKRDRRKTKFFSPSIEKAVPSSSSSSAIASPNPKESNINVEFGAVGYRFRRYYPRYGYYNAEVVEILSNGKRRVKYPDDPEEDDPEELELSLEDIRKCPALIECSPKKKGRETSTSKKTVSKDWTSTDPINRNIHLIGVKARILYADGEYDDGEIVEVGNCGSIWIKGEEMEEPWQLPDLDSIHFILEDNHAKMAEIIKKCEVDQSPTFVTVDTTGNAKRVRLDGNGHIITEKKKKQKQSSGASLGGGDGQNNRNSRRRIPPRNGKCR